MSLRNEQLPYRFASLDAGILACDQCEVLSRVSYDDAQARALENGRGRGGLRSQRQWPVPHERGAAVAAANLKMAAA